MNAPTINLDSNMAREGSAGAGFQSIKTSGAYTGMITKAKFVTASTGTTGIEFAFECVSGASADFMTLWLQKTDGTQLSGVKVLHALLACLRLGTATPANGTVECWDKASSAYRPEQATIYPGLMNKPIGLLLQSEEYLGDSGVKTSMNIFAAFDPESKQMAAEIMDAAPATALDKIVPTLKDKKLAPANQQSSAQEQPPVYDDIPF